LSKDSFVSRDDVVSHEERPQLGRCIKLVISAELAADSAAPGDIGLPNDMELPPLEEFCREIDSFVEEDEALGRVDRLVSTSKRMPTAPTAQGQERVFRQRAALNKAMGIVNPAVTAPKSRTEGLLAGMPARKRERQEFELSSEERQLSADFLRFLAEDAEDDHLDEFLGRAKWGVNTDFGHDDMSKIPEMLTKRPQLLQVALFYG
jgi:hypothetical protein